MSRRHTLAVQALIKTDPAVTSKTYIAEAPRDGQGRLPAAPFVIIYPGNGTDSSDRLSGPRVRESPFFTLHIVGTSWDNTLQLTERLKGLFVVNGWGVPPTISGKLTSDLSWSEPIPIQVDRDTTPAVVYQVVELSFTAEPS